MYENNEICIHCESPDGLLTHTTSQFFEYGIETVSFKKCYSFVTGKSQNTVSSTTNVCEMCMLQLKSAYIFKKKFQPQLSTSLNNEKVEEAIQVETNAIYQESIFVEEQHLIKLEKPPVNSSAPNSFFCDHCEEDFQCQTSLRRHEMSIHGINRLIFKCDMCENEYFSEAGRNNHRYMRHREKYPKRVAGPKTCHYDFQCNECGKMLHGTSGFSLKKHQATHKQTIFECKFCPKKFRVAMGLEVHVQNEHPDKAEASSKGKTLYSCAECGSKYRTPKELVEHHAMHASPNFICSHCLAGFTKSHFLEKHVRTRHQSFQFNCETCKRQFPDKTALVIHTKMYTDASRCQCLVCHSKYPSFNAFKDHYEIAHGLRGVGYNKTNKNCKCHCGKLCQTMPYLHTHISAAHLGKNFECEVCQRSFVTSDALFRHSFDHKDNIFPYMCAEARDCIYRTKIKFAFRVHLKKVHQVVFNPKLHDYDEERSMQISRKHKEILNSDVTITNRSQCFVVQKGSFPCDHCPLSYSTESGWQRHQKEKHLDDQPEFECNECHRKFVCKTQLWTHSFDHKGGIKPYNCVEGTCKFATKYKLSMINHLLGHNITYNESIHGYKDEALSPYRKKKELTKENQMVDVAGVTYWNNY